MTYYQMFLSLVAIHILFGAPGLIGFWVPIASKKGGPRHRNWGRAFTIAMLVAATTALCMSILTISAPLETHPHLVDHPDFSDPELIRAIFGWMMLYLAILTLNLAWYGWQCARNRTNHAANRGPVNLALQVLLTLAAINCIVIGLQIGQPLMTAFSLIGFATVGTNLGFLLNRKPAPVDWLLEHIKAIVGTGISVYTAFFAFGAVRLLPEAALTPALWSLPLVIGLGLIVYHQSKIRRPDMRPWPWARLLGGRLQAAPGDAPAGKDP